MTPTDKNELLDSCMELRDALAAAFRVIANEPGLVAKLEDEFQRIGIKDGIGVRAQEAISRARVSE